MSKSKRESNHRKEERRFQDGGQREFIHEYREHKQEKRVQNILRSNDIEALLEQENYK
jgi:hypothetical protein